MKLPKDGLPMSFHDLSPREQQVAALLALGLHTREVAELLNANLKTIDTHRHNLLRKIGARNTAELARISIRDGWTSMHDEMPLP